MKTSLTTSKYVLILSATLLSLCLLKLLIPTPAQAQQVRKSGSSGTFQLETSGSAIFIIDTRDGTVKLISGGRMRTGRWETDYKEFQ